MSALSRGLAPRMSPLSPRRSAVVAALDIGTSKIVCLIAQLKPFAEGEGMSERTHSIDVIGAGALLVSLAASVVLIRCLRVL